MKSFFNKLFCKHEYETKTNVGGIDIKLLGGCRSIAKCNKCGKIKYNKYLDNGCLSINYYLWKND